MYPPHPVGEKSVLQVLRFAQHLQNALKILGVVRNLNKKIFNSSGREKRSGSEENS